MSDEVEFRWEDLLARVRRDFPHVYRTWFEELPPGILAGGELRVAVPDTQRCRFLREECLSAFVQSAMSLTGRLVSVRFVPPPGAPEPLASTAPAYLQQAALCPDYTFEQFVVGPSNRLAHAACRAVCGQPGSLYNPLFIHGSSGLGKTHLLQATCGELRSRHSESEVLYVSCEAFVNDFVQALERGQLARFREQARCAEALIIDDVQFLAGRESTQEELFHTFNALYQAGRQLVLSADSPPSQIPTLEERLVSRFNWGLVAHIDLPSRETRQAILHKKARLRGYDVPEEVLDFVAARVDANVRLLEGALTKLISEARIAGTAVTVETAERVLNEFSGQPVRALQISDILDAVSKHFAIRLPDLLGRKRSRSISYPRQVAMYLARKLTPLSLQEIGAHFGGRDHSTVLHAERVIDATRLRARETAETLTALTNKLLAGR